MRGHNQPVFVLLLVPVAPHRLTLRVGQVCMTPNSEQQHRLNERAMLCLCTSVLCPNCLFPC